jgi:hypothetical protein
MVSVTNWAWRGTKKGAGKRNACYVTKRKIFE